MTEQLLIHCQKEYEDTLKKLGLKLIEYEWDSGLCTAQVEEKEEIKSDKKLCEFYGIDFDQVLEIEPIG